MNPLPSLTLNFFISSLHIPASVHTIIFLPSILKSFKNFCSEGIIVLDSDVLPGLIFIANGYPSASINNPICTSGNGLCCLLIPYF